MRPKTGQEPDKGPKKPKTAVKTTGFLENPHEIPPFENQRPATTVGGELFRPSLGFPENQFTRQETVEAHAPEDFRVVIHREVFPKIITSSRTKKWDSQPIATEQIIQVADMDGCESLCMTHFAFILGKFPEEALYQCMREAKQAIGCTHLKKVVVDVDEKFVALAVAINAQLDFAHQHGVTDSRVRFAEAGSSHFQFLLANELLVKSEHNDRVVHALKWVILAALIKGGNNEKIEKSKVVFASRPTAPVKKEESEPC